MSSVALLDRCPGVPAAHPAREVEGGMCLSLSVRPPGQQEVPICWERKDKGRLTTERPAIHLGQHCGGAAVHPAIYIFIKSLGEIRDIITCLGSLTLPLPIPPHCCCMLVRMQTIDPQAPTEQLHNSRVHPHSRR